MDRMEFVVENQKHVKYMFDFRTKQCEKFIEHKCNFHKPYNCFDWHFPNQRRRVPTQLPDGTFNYNPDLYCNSYDQNTGYCSNEPDCKYVHMNVGDTERRYHPRYFKTGMCIYETNSDGVCGKNGIHCAFAHDHNDMRRPVHDIREALAGGASANLSAQLEKDRVLSEDPIWNSMEYVLAYYKTEECRKQPKTCRQGYACPYYHNSKDRRRPLSEYVYQSQPCQYLKSANEEWQDVTFCTEQDRCKYSHSRTEQQFHPEIFKSSKCNDILRDTFCPRGPFCAFSHNDEEMNSGQYSNMLKIAFTKFQRKRCHSASQCLSTDPQRSQSTLNVFHYGNSSSTSYLNCLSGAQSLKSSERSSPTSRSPSRDFLMNTMVPGSTTQPPRLIQAQQQSQGCLNWADQPSSAVMVAAQAPTTSSSSSSTNMVDNTSITKAMTQQRTPSTPTTYTTTEIPNIKVILERALSSSSNIQKMSDAEIQLLLTQHSQDPISPTIPTEIPANLANSWISPNMDSSQQTEPTSVESTNRVVEPDNFWRLAEKYRKESERIQQELDSCKSMIAGIGVRYRLFMSWLDDLELDPDKRNEIKRHAGFLIDDDSTTA